MEARDEPPPAVRNPFSVADVPDPLGEDVERFAEDVAVAADPATDENALAWVTVATADEGLAGAWTSRWRTGGGPWSRGVATLHATPERVFILYRDERTYLIEAARRGSRLVGRYVNVAHPTDQSPWVGVLHDPDRPYRIDGYWRGGRWDLRRCSPDERPEPIVAALVTEARQLAAGDLRELVGFARYLRWRASAG
jgi:hypothetical protein